MKSKLFPMILIMIYSGQAQSKDWIKLTNDEFRGEYKKIIERFHAINNYSVTVSMTSYENTSQKVVHDESKGYISKYGSRIHSFLVGIHTIQNEQSRLVVDTANKIMVVAPAQFNTPEDLAPGITEEYLKRITSARKKFENGLTFFDVQMPAGLPFISYTIAFDNKGLIRDVNIILNKEVKNEFGRGIQQCVRIKYDDWDINPTYQASDYSYSPYVKSRGQQFYPTDSYKDYEFHDQRPQLQQP